MNGILETIKKMLGIDESDTAFDIDIIVNINTVLMSLNQMGIGPEECFQITGYTETWTDLLGTAKNLEAIKTYIYIRVRLLFDPPTSSFVIDALNNQAKEFEWRLYVTKENERYIEEQGD